MVEQSPSPSRQSVIVHTLYAKEIFNVSNEAYHEMAMINIETPCLNSLLKKAKALDTESIVYPIPGKLQGVQ